MFSIERARAAELPNHGLGEHVRRDVHLVGALGELRDLLLGTRQVAHPNTRADGLRERGRVDHPPRAVERQHRRRRLIVERQLPVGVVLEDPEAVLGGELDQALALGRRERAAGGVVEVRDQVDQLRRGAFPQEALQRLHVDAVLLQRHADALGAEPLQEEQRAVVGRLLDHHPVPGLDQVLKQHRPGLERAVGDHHLGGIGQVVALGDPFAKPRVPDPRPVGQRPLPIVGERPLRSFPHRLHGQDVGARRAAGEADQLGGHRANEYRNGCQARAPIASTASSAVSVGERPTRTPRPSRASFLASAVPEDPEMIAPAWPICLPGGAVKPAM